MSSHETLIELTFVITGSCMNKTTDGLNIIVRIDKWQTSFESNQSLEITYRLNFS